MQPYNVYCKTHFLKSNLVSINTTTFADCIQACNTYSPNPVIYGGQSCQAVAWTLVNPTEGASNCYLKFAITENSIDSAWDSAALAGNQVPPAIYTASSGSLTSAPTYATSLQISTSSLKTLLSVISTVSSISYTTVAQGFPSHSTAMTHSTFVTSAFVNPSIAGSPCPIGARSPYTLTDSSTYDLYCGYTFESEDPTSVHSSTLVECMNACEQYSTAESSYLCVGVTWNFEATGIENCILHSTVTNVALAPGYDSGYNSDYTLGSPASIRTYIPSVISSSLGASGSSSASLTNLTKAFPCPATLAAEFTTPNYRSYLLYCGYSLNNNNAVTSSSVDTFEQCMQSCGQYTGCVAVTYDLQSGGLDDCFLHESVMEINRDTRYDSSYLASYVPQVSGVTTNLMSSTSLRSSEASTAAVPASVTAGTGTSSVT
ncbi:hypothetical protein MMC09_004611 [Bachmanniomyces sp. S44760]|nr:hypothetical protein [Bachmanniomyces sp. S44760]